MAKYQKDNLKEDSSQFEMLKKLELSQSDFIRIKDYCIQNKIDFCLLLLMKKVQTF